MPKFEVHIPASDRNGFSFTFRVDADGWTAALKAGMARLGQQGGVTGGQGQNMLVDVQDDNSLHVTDAESGRVFQIRELSEVEAQTVPIKRVAAPAAGFSPAAETIIESRAALPEHVRRELDEADRADRARREDSGPMKREDSKRKRQAEALDTTPGRAARGEVKAAGARRDAARTEEEMVAVQPPEPAPAPAPARRGSSPGERAPSRITTSPPSAEPITVLQRRVKPPPEAYPSGLRRVPSAPSGDLARREPTTRRGATPRGQPEMEVVELERPIRPVTGTIGRSRAVRKDQDIEALLSEVFERVQEVYAYEDPTEALYFLLDLALEKIPCDAGSVLEVDEGTGDLRFTAARGPKADELLEANLVVPSGEGIVGFCAHSGVSVALSDVQKDPRYYAAVSRRVDYETRSVLASPMMTHGRTFGCLQLLNRKTSPVFAAHEVGILSYVAHQGALYLNALS